jgi:transcriptional regulator with XRE-family HTH domain
MGEKGTNNPYQTLGSQLKLLREKSHQSLAEVSGAVEIDERTLARIEAGAERPSEDILMLLISYFGMADTQAVQLWELAGYEGEAEKWRSIEVHSQPGKNLVMLVAFDARTLYSDHFEVNANDAGATLVFGQNNGPEQVNPVSKVGMSLEQAERLSHALQAALNQIKQHKRRKTLPPTTDKP